jgi:hypothetical protein
MSKKTNNRYIASNKDTEQPSGLRKCAHHVYSYNYASNMRRHDEIMNIANPKLVTVDMDTTYTIKVAIHFLAPTGSYNRDRVISRAHDIILSINDDFNNYTTNPNTMNNFRYKSIVNQVFIGNMAKQSIYLGPNYVQALPTQPSNIVFELGEIYFYPVTNRLNLSQYNDVTEVEMEYQAIRQYIHQNRADAIAPSQILNIWIVDMTDTLILGFSSFPWETIDNFFGAIFNRRVYFPEDYGETNYNLFKTFTHEIGHVFGLLHVFAHDSGLGAYAAINLHAGDPIGNFTGDYIADTPSQLAPTYDPTNKVVYRRLNFDNDYNPLFMDFMDFTYDKYVTIFTFNQIQKMRYMIITYLPGLIGGDFVLPLPKYNPDTNTLVGVVNGTPVRPLVPEAVVPTTNANNQTASAYDLQIQSLLPVEPQTPFVPPSTNPQDVTPMVDPRFNPMNPANQLNQFPELTQFSAMPTQPSIQQPTQQFLSYYQDQFTQPQIPQVQQPFPQQQFAPQQFTPQQFAQQVSQQPFNVGTGVEIPVNMINERQRNYPKYSQAVTSTKINSLSPNYVPQPSTLQQATQMRLQKPQFAPMNNSIQVDPVPPMNYGPNTKSMTSQLISNMGNLGGSSKFTKYGQPIGPQNSMLAPSRNEPVKTPKKRFTRVKPAVTDV